MAGCLTNRRFPVGLIPSPRGTLGQRQNATTMRAWLRTKCSMGNVRQVPPVTGRLVHHDSFQFPITAATPLSSTPHEVSQLLSRSRADRRKVAGAVGKTYTKLFEGILRVTSARASRRFQTGDRPPSAEKPSSAEPRAG